MLDLKSSKDYESQTGDKWDYCYMCGPQDKRVVIHFDSGSVAPTTGETVTGATSTNTGVVSEYTLTSGTFAAGTAAGVVVVTSPSGYDKHKLTIFQDNEALNGGTSGSDFATVNGQPTVSLTGRLHPSSELIEYQGRNYCKAHFQYRYKQEWSDDIKVDKSVENERWR